MEKLKASWKFFKKEVIVDSDGNDYLRRWKLIQTPWFGIFIHNILRSDTDRDLHDHPWNFTTIILRGEYHEEVNGIRNVKIRKAPCIIRHKAEDSHRVTIIKPVWSLFIIGPKRRQWGFLTNEGWVHHQEYNDTKYLK